MGADLGISPAAYFRGQCGWDSPELPDDFVQHVPKDLINNWNARCDTVLRLSRLLDIEDWLEVGHMNNPIEQRIGDAITPVMSVPCHSENGAGEMT